MFSLSLIFRRNYMKSKRIYSLISLLVVMLAIIIASVISNNAFSQTSKNIDGGKSQPVVWKRVEQPVKSVDSNFRLDLSTLMTGTNYIIGVKPAKDGEKEKMYTGIVTWESNEKIKGF